MIKWLQGIYSFAHHWCSTRKWRSLLASVPALIGMFGFVGLLVAGRVTSRDGLLTQYEKASREAIDSGDYESAEVFIRRQLHFRPNDTELRLQQVRVYQQQDKHAQAESLLQLLAPEDGVGSAEAHAFLAGYIAGGGLEAHEVTRFERHVRKAIDQQPDHARANALMGGLLVSRGQLDQAVEHYEIAARHMPAIRMTLAEIHRVRGDRPRVEDQAMLAEVHYRAAVTKKPADVELRLMWSRALMLLERIEDAQRAVEEGLQRGEDGRLRSALGQIFVTRAETARTQRKYDRFVTEIQRAIEAAPTEPVVLNYVSDHVLNNDDQDYAELRQSLRRKLLNGDSPGGAHFVLGTAAAARGNFAEANLHLEQAYQHQPASLVIANNLAWCILHAPDGDLERALHLVDAALEVAPAETRIRDTRGRILLKLGRAQEALRDLEVALKSSSRPARIHAVLAECYEFLGDQELAGEHRSLSEEAQ